MRTKKMNKRLKTDFRLWGIKKGFQVRISLGGQMIKHQTSRIDTINLLGLPKYLATCSLAEMKTKRQMDQVRAGHP